MGSRNLAAALLLPALLGSADPPPASAAEDGPDAPVLRRIRDLRERATRLRIDGRAADWEGFPSFEDRDPAPVAERGLDLRRIAVAPRDWDVLVTFDCAGAPSRAPFAFSLDLDFLGRSARDACVRFGAEGPAEATVFPERGKPWRLMDPFRMDVAVADAVEVRIPLDGLLSAIGGPEAKEWIEGRRRPFVRVQARTAADEGASAASFRLVAPPLDLDPRLPPGGEPRRAVRPPVEGKWFVRQAADGLWSHQGVQAYDLALVDHALRSCPVAGSKRLEDYPAFGRSVVAPEPGSIAFDSAQEEDRPPLEGSTGKGSGNTLILRFADGMRLLLGHLQKGSFEFPRGGEFAAGAGIARVGNSGDSGAPHLHVSLHDRPGEFVGLPLAFTAVRVGLNPGPDDPWARDLATWAIREGWFVEGR